MLSNKFFTNTSPNSLLNKFNAVFENNPHIQIFHCVSGYFRASGYHLLKEKLQALSEVKILVGIDVDKINDFFSKKNELPLNADKLVNIEYAGLFADDIKNADYTQTSENSISDFLKAAQNNAHIEVRIHQSKKLHAKIYVFLPHDYNEHTAGSVITGSSNFTSPGLGSADHNNNYEFNVELRDYADVSFAESEFQTLWAESIPVDWNTVNHEVKKTHIDQIAQPYYLYIKFLIEYFGDRIDFDEDSIGDVPPQYKKLRYQVDAVSEAYKMLLDFDGCFLADVVGLGKTMVAAMTANKLAIENSKKKTRILVVYPPALERNWKETFKEFKLIGITDFISIGSLHLILDPDNTAISYSKEDYSLIIVDEAHRFRNANTERYKQLQLITKSPIKDSENNFIKKKKILLLTATPFNNDPNDILNMILLFTDKYNSSLPIGNLGNFFTPLVAQYKQIIHDPHEKHKLEPLMAKLRNDIIQPITVRRTRKDLLHNQMYANDIKAQNIHFPKIDKPHIYDYILDAETDSLFAQTVDDISKNLTYVRYQILTFLKNDVLQKYYPEMDVDLMTMNLASLMKVRMIKSLESSFDAFKSTVYNLLNSTKEMVHMIDAGKVFFAPNGKLMDWLDKNLSYDDIEEEIEKKQEKGSAGYNTFSVADDFDTSRLLEAKEKLTSDTVILQQMYTNWTKVIHDPKYEKFITVLPQLIQKTDKNPSGKIVIFSESKVTCNYLAEKLQSNNFGCIFNISADNRDELFSIVRANFDANIPEENQKDDYNILITTEVLAEGVNLHRANHLLNYDIPWNSTKLMQRLGRVNRIGSKADTVYNYAFYPSTQGDTQIDLKNKAHTKLQAFHYTFGEDSQILSTKEQLIDVVLHNPENAEQEDERLRFLQHVRDLKATDKELYNKIKKIPLKSRSILAATQESKKQHVSSVVFLKTGEKKRFFFCRNTETCSVDFVTFAKVLECMPTTKAHNQLTEQHYIDVQNAIKEFENIEVETSIHVTAKPNDVKLLNLIKSLRQERNTENETAVDSIISLLEQGTYTHLRKKVSACLKNPNFDIAIKNLAKEFSKQKSKQGELKEIPELSEKPQIILSETFL